MVENNMGVGIAGVKTAAQAVKEGKFVAWWIEGAEMKWELGLARLRGGYFSPIAHEFARLCRESFAEKETELKRKSKAK